MTPSIKFDNRDFQRALRRYADVRKMGLDDALRRRVKPFAIKLFQQFKSKQPQKGILRADLQKRKALKVRPEARKHRTPRRKEISLRVKNIGWTAYGWIAAAIAYGEKMRMPKHFRMRVKGLAFSRFTFFKKSITLVNPYAGAVAMDKQHDLVKKAVAEETQDMTDYIEKKLARHARRSRL